ncbi:hypothetical protein HELRODRAFT_170690 [Helobdella robusta]|uniref:C2H2-type domain-containing protein n=1 Tax=Helobdella robusta TaxID=6412 RepID=T1F3B5_HELRO|nr:hypothetical protein HELRODRAFT_170690 [Helobdella robusta]ESO07357.1 hypothetical protein HELRODRAFT_170690 [Helobdella robusta]
MTSSTSSPSSSKNQFSSHGANALSASSVPSTLPTPLLLADSATTADMTPFSDSFSSLMFSLAMGSSYPTDLTNSSIFSQFPMTSAPTSLLNTGSPNLSAITNLMFMNPFSSPMSLLKNFPFLFNSNPTSASSTTSSLNTLTELQKFNFTNTPLNDFYKEGSADQSASCSLCRKDFCNSYFLKIHKRDKHGIPIEDVVGSSASLSKKSFASSSNSSLKDGLYNLDVIEPGENISTFNKINNDTLSTDNKNVSFTSAASSGQSTALPPSLQDCKVTSCEETCVFCKQMFNNRYSLMVHLLSAHNIKPEGFGLASELMQLENLSAGQQNHTRQMITTSNLTSSSGKISERVACNICNKEVCNKYFLRTHKLKVHGIRDAGFDGAANNSNNNISINNNNNHNNNVNNNSEQQKSRDGSAVKEQKTSAGNVEQSGNNFSASTSDVKFNANYTNDNEQNKNHSNFFKNFSQTNSDFYDSFNKNDSSLFSESSKPTNPFELLDLSQLPKNSAPSRPTKSTSATSSKSNAGKISEEAPPSKQSFDPEAYCEICKKEFCSKYFLKTHKQKIHGLRSDTDNRSPSLLPQMSGFGLPSTYLTDPSTASLFSLDSFLSKSKDQQPSNMTRVTCEICGKELCNKYFLRTHMLKIHGISETSTLKNICDPNKQDSNATASSRKSSPFSTLDILDRNESTSSPTANNSASKVDDRYYLNQQQQFTQHFLPNDAKDARINKETPTKPFENEVHIDPSSSNYEAPMKQPRFQSDMNQSASNISISRISNQSTPPPALNKNDSQTFNNAFNQTTNNVSDTLSNKLAATQNRKRQRCCSSGDSGERQPQQQQNKTTTSSTTQTTMTSSTTTTTTTKMMAINQSKKKKFDEGTRLKFDEYVPVNFSNNDNNDVNINNFDNNNKFDNQMNENNTYDNSNNNDKHSSKYPSHNSNSNSNNNTQTTTNNNTTTTNNNNDDVSSDQSVVMQTFEMKEKPAENTFAQCKLFLPVVQTISEPITLKFTVTPLER